MDFSKQHGGCLKANRCQLKVIRVGLNEHVDVHITLATPNLSLIPKSFSVSSREIRNLLETLFTFVIERGNFLWGKDIATKVSVLKEIWIGFMYTDRCISVSQCNIVPGVIGMASL